MVWSSDVSDLQIAELIRDDSQQGFTLLLRQYGGRIRGYLRARFPSLDEHEVQDALTDAMLALATTFDASRGTLPAWFLLLAHQRAVGRLRSRAFGVPVAEGGEDVLPPASGGASLLDELVSRERVREVHEAVASLPPLERAVVQADLEEGSAVAARRLAQQLGTTDGSIYAARKRARQKLMERCDWIRVILQSENTHERKT